METIRTTCTMLTPIVADYNQVIEGVPEKVARQLVQMGNAVIITEAGDVESPQDTLMRLAEEWAPVVAAGPEPRETLAPEETGSSLGADSSLTPEGVREVPDTEQKLTCPAGNAAKGQWVKWALYKDAELTEEAARGMSKMQLQGKYGERL